MSLFLTSDHHFNHDRMLELCYTRACFASVEEMNEVMIQRWNEVVKPEDTVWHLGDFGFGSKESLKAICSQLNGHKLLAKGNHDRGSAAMFEIGFEEVVSEFVLECYRNETQYSILLAHKPVDLKHRSLPPADVTLQFCGHLHEKWLRADVREAESKEGKLYMKGFPSLTGSCINVGVDQHHFYPQTLEALLAL